ncbi:MAG: hypothetical protein KC535_04350 [Nanoarchaeota archaeon]|nr:hypothetical protein [Nanoarchaeota archaeon]
MSVTKKIFSVLTIVCILLNLVVLVSGYSSIDELSKIKSSIGQETSYYLKKEEDVLAKLDILKQSNDDSYANLKVLQEKTNSLKDQVQQYTVDYQSSTSQKAFYENQLDAAQQETVYLENKIASTQRAILRQQQAAMAARRTRAS